MRWKTEERKAKQLSFNTHLYVYITSDQANTEVKREKKRSLFNICMCIS